MSKRVQKTLILRKKEGVWTAENLSNHSLVSKGATFLECVTEAQQVCHKEERLLPEPTEAMVTMVYVMEDKE